MNNNVNYLEQAQGSVALAVEAQYMENGYTTFVCPKAIKEQVARKEEVKEITKQINNRDAMSNAAWLQEHMSHVDNDAPSYIKKRNSQSLKASIRKQEALYDEALVMGNRNSKARQERQVALEETLQLNNTSTFKHKAVKWVVDFINGK